MTGQRKSGKWQGWWGEQGGRAHIFKSKHGAEGWRETEMRERERERAGSRAR